MGLGAGRRPLGSTLHGTQTRTVWLEWGKAGARRSARRPAAHTAAEYAYTLKLAKVVPERRR